MSAKYREAFTRALLCQPPNSPSRPTDNTCTTAATNLLNSSSYMGAQLKGFLDGRRASRASTDRRQEERGRSSSLEPSSCLLVAGNTNPLRASLCRQKSQSTEGRQGGLLAPPPSYIQPPPSYISTRV